MFLMSISSPFLSLTPKESWTAIKSCTILLKDSQFANTAFLPSPSKVALTKSPTTPSALTMKLPPPLTLGLVFSLPAPLSPPKIIFEQLLKSPETANAPLLLLGGSAMLFKTPKPSLNTVSPTALAPSPELLLAFLKTRLMIFPVMLSLPPLAPASRLCLHIELPLTKFKTTPNTTSSNPSPKL